MYGDDFVVDLVKVFAVGVFAVLLASALTPSLTSFLFENKLWKKKNKAISIDGKEARYFNKFHSEKETKVPRIGGLLIWCSVSFLALLLFFLSNLFDFFWIEKFDFLSRDQTWLPLFTLISASLVGLSDDLLQIVRNPRNIFLRKIWRRAEDGLGEGLGLRYRIILVTVIGLIGAWWFYFRLGQESIYLPFLEEVSLGVFYIPFFIIVMVAIYSGGVIDGIDGLAGGVFISIFSAYTIISFLQGQLNLAAFCIAIVGSVLVFLWFNIPPARFYMGETGIIGLTTTVTVVAFLTGAVFVLPIIAFPLIITSLSVIIQLLSKKFRGKKVFLAAPLHHHLEAIGWPQHKITMRFWVVSALMGIVGVLIHLLL